MEFLVNKYLLEAFKCDAGSKDEEEIKKLLFLFDNFDIFYQKYE